MDQFQLTQDQYDEIIKKLADFELFKTHMHTGVDSLQILFSNLVGSSSGGSGTSAYARSHGTNNTSIAGSAVDVKVQLNTNDFATGITWDSANNRFTILTTGKYMVMAQAYYTSITNTGKQAHTEIFVNGSQVLDSIGGNAAAGLGVSPTIADVLSLNATDFVELDAKHTDSVNASITNSNLTYLALVRVA